MELNQMTDQQVKTLETYYLTTNIREKIDAELKKKMGIYLSVEMSAHISWCALIVSWISLY